MPRVRPLEVKALVPLLEQDWETPEQLAEALILALDEARASRVSYVGVLQLGSGPGVMYVGVGPYPGAASARNAVTNHPAAAMAKGRAIVSVRSPEGFKKLLDEVDAPAPSKGDFAEVEKDALARKRGWGGKARDRQQYLDQEEAS